MRRRLQHAIALFGNGIAACLICSGGRTGGRSSEAEIMARDAVASGIPEERILLEERASDTFGNARYSAGIMRQHGWSRAMVVSDGYHLPRALFAFRLFGIVAAGSAPDAARAPSSTMLAREAIAICWYGLRGIPVLLARRVFLARRRKAPAHASVRRQSQADRFV